MNEDRKISLNFDDGDAPFWIDVRKIVKRTFFDFNCFPI